MEPEHAENTATELPYENTASALENDQSEKSEVEESPSDLETTLQDEDVQQLVSDMLFEICDSSDVGGD